jgi:hypothetical protein
LSRPDSFWNLTARGTCSKQSRAMEDALWLPGTPTALALSRQNSRSAPPNITKPYSHSCGVGKSPGFNYGGVRFGLAGCNKFGYRSEQWLWLVRHASRPTEELFELLTRVRLLFTLKRLTHNLQLLSRQERPLFRIVILMHCLRLFSGIETCCWNAATEPRLVHQRSPINSLWQAVFWEHV